MRHKKEAGSTATFERSTANPGAAFYELRLYVAGMTPRSARAIANIKEICAEYLKGHYDLKVFDIYQQPVLTAGEQIIAVPTLIKKLPLPLRRIIGDLSNRERVLVGLDLKPKPTGACAG
jgi:circadian clock protein KaiB